MAAIIKQFTIYTVPFIILGVLIFGYLKGVKLYEVFVEGAMEGFNISIKILPYLVTMLFAIAILRESGALNLITAACAPALKLLGIPPEVLPLVLMKPMSGSGSLGITAEIIQKYGPDSLIGRIASTMMGSTETIFYTMAVYYGAIGIKKMRHTLISAILAHGAGVIASCIICRMVFGS
ncbi:spore maturation protein B [Oxobacter pfennigii]|uniref:Spore maturation protein B n=1 Tax=Oxobacter pfennigii TaxID=36849 RepID=A0A0P8Y8L6_9CLOT|nr:spore maturation protein [Oxobacter pfennigii]KPU43078.1 spore maturation protein B [Oxobacter pfennigii]